MSASANDPSSAPSHQVTFPSNTASVSATPTTSDTQTRTNGDGQNKSDSQPAEPVESYASDWRTSIGLRVYATKKDYSEARAAHGELADAGATTFSTLAILSTFLGGTQATLLPFFDPANEAAQRDASLADIARYLGIGALCLHLVVTILSTVIVLFMVLEKVLVLTSRQGGTDKDYELGPLLGNAAEYHGSLRTGTTERHPAASATRITARMSWLLRLLAIVLIVGTFITLVNVLLYGWLQDSPARWIVVVAVAVSIVAISTLFIWVLVWGGKLQLASVHRVDQNNFEGWVVPTLRGWLSLRRRRQSGQDPPLPVTASNQ